VVVDRSRHRDDIDVAAGEHGRIVSAGQIFGVLKFGSVHFHRTVVAFPEFGNALGIDIESDRREYLGKLDGQRQSHIA
jgi:hypothetical protein